MPYDIGKRVLFRTVETEGISNKIKPTNAHKMISLLNMYFNFADNNSWFYFSNVQKFANMKKKL